MIDYGDVAPDDTERSSMCGLDGMLCQAEDEIDHLETLWRKLTWRQRRRILRACMRTFPHKAIFTNDQWHTHALADLESDNKACKSILMIIGMAILSEIIKLLCQWLWEWWQKRQDKDAARAEMAAMAE